MKRPLFCRLLPWLVIGFATVMIILAIGAGYIGADADNKWGPFRKGILILGLTALFLPIGLKIVGAIDLRLMEKQLSFGLRSGLEVIVRRFTARSPDASSPLESQELSHLPESSIIESGTLDVRKAIEDRVSIKAILSRFVIHRRGLGIVVLFVAVELLYVWFVSVGHMTTWPNETSYYGMLAEAFTQGQTALMIEPDPKLAELENPYPTAERPGIRVISDLSYFEGKYYAYWGPVPAVIAAVLTIITADVVGDEYVVFAAVSCIFLFSLLILLHLRRKYFPRLPGWLFIVGILIIATAHPMLWVLNWPSIYPAAIASGQAFLITGLFFAIPVIEGTQRQPWRLVLVGVLWASALGSRTSIAPALALLTLATAIVLYFSQDSKRKGYDALKKSVMLIFPIVIGIALLGSYNYVRFGNFLQTGFRYAMSTNDLPQMLDSGLVFNPVYLLPNIFYILIAPIKIRTQFPIIRPLWNEIPEVSMFTARFNIPDVYRIEDISGILVAMPSIILVGYLVWELICYRRVRDLEEPSSFKDSREPGSLPGFRRIIWVILFTGIIAAAPIFFFFWIANRYLLDAVPLFAILAAMGAWLLYMSTRRYPLRGSLAVFFILITVFLGILISFLLAISGADSRFDDLNPALFETLSNLFSLKQ